MPPFLKHFKAHLNTRYDQTLIFENLVLKNKTTIVIIVKKFFEQRKTLKNICLKCYKLSENVYISLQKYFISLLFTLVVINVCLKNSTNKGINSSDQQTSYLSTFLNSQEYKQVLVVIYNFLKNILIISVENNNELPFPL